MIELPVASSGHHYNTITGVLQIKVTCKGTLTFQLSQLFFLENCDGKQF